MLTVKVFGKRDCELCKNAIHKFEYFMRHWGIEDGVDVHFVDMDTEEGLADAMMHDAAKVPTTVILSESGEELARWEGVVPPSEEFKPVIAGGSR